MKTKTLGVKQRFYTAMGIVAMACLLPSATATVINGGSLACTTAQDPSGSFALNGASLLVEAGCQFGSSLTSTGLVLADTSSLNMTGGSILADMSAGAGTGLDANGDGSITISSGTISASSAFVVQSNYPLITISGGSFQGSAAGGAGLDTLLGLNSIVDITNGLFSGGDAVRSGGTAPSKFRAARSRAG